MKYTRELRESMRAILRLNDNKDGFVWVNSRGGKALAGTPAGSVRKDGYINLSILKSNYLLHRLMWLWYYGEFDEGMEIDHIDGDKSNNAIYNLRLATRQENATNRGVQSNNKSGIKNVFLDKRSGKWLVKMKVQDKYKWFGLHESLELAELVAVEASSKYQGTFARSQ